MYENNLPHQRYAKTLAFIEQYIDKHEAILDLGVENPFSDILKTKSYTVYNTQGEDLDENYAFVKEYQVEAVTALEILEHLVSPLPLLKALPGKKLIATIPLNLWFAKAYRSHTDDRDRHYHEFEDWQFDWLLEKAGWKIIAKEKWTAPTGKIGIRPLLRKITPRYYAVYAERV